MCFSRWTTSPQSMLDGRGQDRARGEWRVGDWRGVRVEGLFGWGARFRGRLGGARRGRWPGCCSR